MHKQELLQQAQDRGINSRDAEMIILHNTGLSKSQYFLIDTIDNSELILAEFKKLTASLLTPTTKSVIANTASAIIMKR